MDVHDLTAAYALDALDPEEERSYEQHLAGCERCREELAAFSEVAGSLALAVDPAEPAPALRDRVLVAARSERPNVAPLRPRWTYPLAAAAAVAACSAIGLGIWAATLHSRLDRSELHPYQWCDKLDASALNRRCRVHAACDRDRIEPKRLDVPERFATKYTRPRSRWPAGRRSRS